MNKRLILAAIAVALSASCAQATNVTGATGGNGVYTVAPEKFSGIAGYRKYDNFTVSKGDVLNMDFTRPGEGKTQPTAFVNLVGKNGVNINGIVNTVRGNNFYNGHAIFITPGGFIVGQSGVLNVGRLSVATPTASKYNDLASKYDADNVFAIGQEVSKLTQNSQGNAGATDVNINGKIFARDRVEISGAEVTIPGNIVNGIKATNILNSEETANALFASLVNTDGTVKNATQFASNGGRILIKSYESLNVSGTVTNGVGDVYLTNNGNNGLYVSGKVAAKDLARAYSTKGNMEIRNDAEFNAKKIVAQNKGNNLTLTSGSKVTGSDRVEILNQGSGALRASGVVNANGALVVKNEGSDMTLDGTFTNKSGETAINNLNGAMLIDGTFDNKGNMGIINRGTGAIITKNATITNEGKLKIANTGANGLTFVGDVNNKGEVRIYNDGGKLTFGTDSTGAKAAQITNEGGKLYIAARKDATGISQSTASNITNKDGNLVIRNSGTKTASGTRGLDLQGGVKNTNGIVAVNNDFGDMYVSSNVEVSKGNLGIINRANGGTMTLASAGKVDVEGGNINIKNFGKGDMTVNSAITHDGRVNVLANSGALNLGSKVTNNSGALGQNGGFYAAARKQGTGINVSSEFVANGNGEVLIKNISGNNGLRYAGKIDTTGHQAALVNHKGAMNVSGSIKTTKAPIVVSSKGDKLTVTNTTNLNSGTKGNLFVHLDSPDPSVSTNATLTNMEGHGKLKGKI